MCRRGAIVSPAGGFHQWAPIAGWFIREDPIKMEDLDGFRGFRGTPVLETPI